MSRATTNASAQRREAAVDWWMRRRSGPLDARELAAFDAWRADPANAAALDNIEGLCAQLSALPAPRARRPILARPRVWLGVAAPLATAALALVLNWGDLAALLRSDHFAGTGEMKLVTLEDGSRAHLNARSAIAVHYETGERRLELLAGEAWFEVSPDAARPFVVVAASGRITALGTAFDVALDESGARVTVTEHSVRIASGGGEVLVGEGEQSAFRASATASAPASVKTGWVTAWRRGKLIVENAPLRDVVATLGRYHHGYVACSSAAICARAVTGVFSVENPQQTLEAIETALGLRATSLTRFVTLLHE
jgi:transmembrane sensor